MARSERFELPTPRFEVWCSIQLSYERGSLPLIRSRPLFNRRRAGPLARTDPHKF